MYILSINDKCDNCGECEQHLPNLLDNIEEYNTILISDTNLFEHSINIAKAIDLCDNDAIDLTEYNDD